MTDTKPGFLLKIHKSMTDLKYYKQLIKLSTGSAITYLLLFTFILGTISMIRPIYVYSQGVANFENGFEQKIPDFKLSGGKLQINAKMPIIIDSPDNVIIIDTRKEANDKLLDIYKNGLMFLEDKMISRQNNIDQDFIYPNITGMDYTRANLKSVLPYLKWMTPIIAVMGVLFFMIGKFCSVLLMSLLGKAVNSSMQAPLSFSKIFRLSAYSFTLPIILKVIFDSADANIGFFWMIYYAIAFFYISFAMSLIKRDAEAGEILK